MDETEKLDILLAHWIEHNESHVGTYKEWAEKLKGGGRAEIGGKIEEAVESISIANERFKEAKEMLKVK
ncbi:MAG: hypothetical protein ABH845_00470 [Candidatus Omnitrophota bacterium]